MAGVNLNKGEQTKKGQIGKKRKRRIRIKVDMTPMVDIVMLLLIFYMVTTVFTMPQAMELNLPPVDGTSPIVKYENLLLIRVDDQNRISWQNWDPKFRLPEMIPSESDNEYRADTDSLLNVMYQLSLSNSLLNTLVKIDSSADYRLMVDILDEIDRTERKINRRLANEMEIEFEQIPPKLRFSYRYALGDWKESDMKIARDTWANFNGGGQIIDQ